MLPNVLQRSGADPHVPVLADEVRELLAVRPGETVVDATFGAGGHARLLARDLEGEGKLVAIDRDPTVKPFFDRFKAASGVETRFLRGDFAVVLSQLAANDVRADAVLLDLGVSSMQIDRAERGFSYATDAPLDMRMDTSAELSARDIVNEWDEDELVTIFRRYGEERYAPAIARSIARRRVTDALHTHGRARRHDQVGHPHTGALRRGASGETRLPGLADRSQRRARRARSSAACGCRDAPARRAARRDLVPLAGGSPRQAVPPGTGERLHLPAGLPDLRLRQGAGAPLADAQGRPSFRSRAGCQPARSICTAAGRGDRMTSYAETAQAEPKRRRAEPRARKAAVAPRAERRARSRSTLGGVLWITVVAVLLAGVVAVNVAVLRLNVRLDKVSRKRVDLQADVARLQSDLSSAGASAQISRDAQSKLALVPADPSTTRYLDLKP